MFTGKTVTACHLGPPAMVGDFATSHHFLYAITQPIKVDDGLQEHVINPGQFCLIRKDHLARFNLDSTGKQLEKVTLTFDADFLKNFLERHPGAVNLVNTNGAATQPAFNDMVNMFVAGLAPFFSNGNTLDSRFADLKREELLMILLHVNPELKGILYHTINPERADLPAFMNSHFRFNAGIEHFAFLSGRSLSGFKRDFKKAFNSNPGQWLVQRRLEEAKYLIDKKGRRPVEIYLDLGFEDLSHFSFAFKKKYGKAPSTLVKQPYRRLC